MNLLITGATGFVGTELVNVLTKNKKYHVNRIVRNKDDSSDHNFYISTIDKNTDWSNILKNIDVVIHLASKVHDMNFVEDNRNDNIFYQINSEGTENLLEHMVTHKVKKIIFLSTIKVNGENNTSHEFSEDDKPNPIGSYGKSKYEAEKYIIDYSKRFNINYTIIRPTLVIGPNVKGNMLLLMKLVQNRIPFPFFKKENQRSMIGIRNLCNLIEFCLINDHLNNEIVIASNKECISTYELLINICKQMKKRILFVPLPEILKRILKKLPIVKSYVSRLYDDLLVNNTKLHQESGWVQKYSIDEEIKYMVKNTVLGDDE